MKIVSTTQEQLNEDLANAAKRGEMELVKAALENGADVTANECMAFRWAASNGHYDVTQLLLDKGVDIHAGNNYAFAYAAENDHYEIVKLLLDRGFGINAAEDYLKQYSSVNGRTKTILLLQDAIKSNLSSQIIMGMNTQINSEELRQKIEDCQNRLHDLHLLPKSELNEATYFKILEEQDTYIEQLTTGKAEMYFDTKPTMQCLIDQLVNTWKGGKKIFESEIRNLELAAIDYLYISRDSIDDVGLVKEIEEKFLSGITAKEAIMASNVLADLVRKGIAKDPSKETRLTLEDAVSKVNKINKKTTDLQQK